MQVHPQQECKHPPQKPGTWLLVNLLPEQDQQGSKEEGIHLCANGGEKSQVREKSRQRRTQGRNPETCSQFRGAPPAQSAGSRREQKFHDQQRASAQPPRYEICDRPRAPFVIDPRVPVARGKRVRTQ
jgi:hypothetical protein